MGIMRKQREGQIIPEGSPISAGGLWVLDRGHADFRERFGGECRPIRICRIAAVRSGQGVLEGRRVSLGIMRLDKMG